MRASLITIIFFFTVSITKACEIESFHQIIKINNVLDDSIIKKTNCNNDQISSFIGLISSANGKLSSTIVSSSFNIELTPKNIFIESINDYLQENLSKNNNILINNTTSMYGSASINLNKTDNLNIICNSCNKPEKKNIKLLINNKTHWVTSNLLIQRAAYVAKVDLSINSSNISKEMFKKVIVKDNGRKSLFNSIEQIRFYRPTQNIPAGTVLKRHFLRAQNAVNSGQKVKVQVIGKEIRLDTIAIARKSGKVGEYIQVMNPKSKKISRAKVIDFNKVVMNL